VDESAPYDVSTPKQGQEPSPPSGGALDPAASLGAALTGPPPTLGRARAPRKRRSSGAWPAGGVARVSPDSLESVADDVAYWLETTSQDAAKDLMDGVYAPFAARVNPEQAARFYAETLFTPEGTLDPKQWQKEYARLGPQGLADAINGGARYRLQRGLRVLLPTSRFQPVGTQMTLPTPAAGIVPDAAGLPAPPEGEYTPGVPGMVGQGMMDDGGEGAEGAEGGPE